MLIKYKQQLGELLTLCKSTADVDVMQIYTLDSYYKDTKSNRSIITWFKTHEILLNYSDGYLKPQSKGYC